MRLISCCCSAKFPSDDHRNTNAALEMRGSMDDSPVGASDNVIKNHDFSANCESGETGRASSPSADDEVIVNPDFNDGVQAWSGRGCEILWKTDSGGNYATTRNRTQAWNGIEQDITARIRRKHAYQATAKMRISGGNSATADVRLTLWIRTSDGREEYVSIGTAQGNKVEWSQIQEKFLISASPDKAVIYVEGPPKGTDIHLRHLNADRSPTVIPDGPPIVPDSCYGVDIIENSNLRNGTDSWFPIGDCVLTVETGSPRIPPPMAEASLGDGGSLGSGRFIRATNRKEKWMGPAQMITDRIRLFVTYQVSAWVRVVGATAREIVNAALAVDGEWVNGGQLEASDERWYEIGGSFRIEKAPEKVMVYVQGPSPGTDLMVSDLRIFAVDRRRRFKHLKKRTDEVRKRDVILKLTGARSRSFARSHMKVKQIHNSFPLGSCISRSIIDNEDFTSFFLKNFNWSVFGNELKWYWTEAERGKLNYRDADELLAFCRSNGVETRGHCIFWEVESMVQQWVRSLNNADLLAAVHGRITGLLTRYSLQFRQYDVNNEMLHGSFYRDRLGEGIRSLMFAESHKVDPSATLFANDYHVFDGEDDRSSPEKYVEQILDLQKRGAPVGGIGVQGHANCPVGPVISSGLDKLGVLGLPVWFTELDVSSSNEHVRADDLEVMLREAYAHPAVAGVVLWGFWELFCRRNGHLVNAEGAPNTAGRRFLALKREWLTSVHGCADEKSEFPFRGFGGTYVTDIISPEGEMISAKFTVEEDGENEIRIVV